VTDKPGESGVPLRVVVALGLSASLLARCVAPALPGLSTGMEVAIVWTERAASLLTLLAATGLIAGIARLASLIVASPQAPLVARLVAVPSVTLGCMLLLFASFRPLEPALALGLGISAAVVGMLSARHCLPQRERRAGALVLGLTASGGLIHVFSRKLTQDASEAANLAVFRGAELLETLALSIDLVALALACVWLQRKAPRGRILVPVMLVVSGVCVLLALRGFTPGASTTSVLLSRALEALRREQSSFLPLALGYMLSASSLLAALAALLVGGELGLIMAVCLAARGALDIPVPALMLELGALYLPMARSWVGPSAALSPEPAPAADTSPP
jgi:hypothetical protein